MKHVISISIQMETLGRIKERVRQDSSFRNKSHLIEYAVERLLKDGI